MKSNSIDDRGETEDVDSSAAALSSSSSTATLEPGRLRAIFYRLQLAGLSPGQAGNVTAHLVGLHAVQPGWTVQEIERLLFVRALVDQGRLT